MEAQPLFDRVLVKRDETETMTKTGIVITTPENEVKALQGKVVAIGPGRVLKDGNHKAITVKVGDVVLFGKYAGSEIKVDDAELMIMREDDLLCILKQ